MIDNRSTDKDLKQLELLTLYWQECKNGTTTLEKSLTGSYKMKHILTLTNQSNNTTCRYLIKRNENIWPHKVLSINGHTVLFVIAQALKQPKYTSVGKWINKLVYIIQWKLFSYRKELTTNTKNRWVLVTLCQVKKVYIVWTHSYEILEKVKLTYCEWADKQLPGIGGQGLTTKEHKSFLG